MTETESTQENQEPETPLDNDQGETQQLDRPEGPDPLRRSALVEIVKDRLGTILAAALILLAIAVWAGWDLSIPRFWHIYGLSFLFLLPAGWLVTSWAKSYLVDPQPDWLIDLDARQTDGQLVKCPPGSLEQIEITEGQICQLAPSLYTARQVDLENRTAKGTWRGTLDDRELLVALEAVYECRGALEDQARRGFAIEKRFFSLLRNTTRQEVLSVVETFEKGTLPNGTETLKENIDSVLEDHGLDEQIKTDASDFSLTDSMKKSETNHTDNMVANGEQTND